MLTDLEETGRDKGLLHNANGTTIQPQFTGIQSKLLSVNAAKNKQHEYCVSQTTTLGRRLNCLHCKCSKKYLLIALPGAKKNNSAWMLAGLHTKTVLYRADSVDWYAVLAQRANTVYQLLWKKNNCWENDSHWRSCKQWSFQA